MVVLSAAGCNSRAVESCGGKPVLGERSHETAAHERLKAAEGEEGGVSWNHHESKRENWSDSLCKSWSQVHTVDQTVHPPNKHSFVSLRLLVGRWPPA